MLRAELEQGRKHDQYVSAVPDDIDHGAAAQLDRAHRTGE
jgi:hypothetical protein